MNRARVTRTCNEGAFRVERDRIDLRELTASAEFLQQLSSLRIVNSDDSPFLRSSSELRAFRVQLQAVQCTLMRFDVRVLVLLV